MTLITKSAAESASVLAGAVILSGLALTELVMKLKAQKKSIVLIEHNLPITMKVCDRIMVLSYGKKIAEGTPEEVKNNKQVIEAYLGEEEE